MNKVDVRLTRGAGDSVAVGQLAEVDRRVYFEYEAAFLASGLRLSPFKLPLAPGLTEHVDRRFGPLPGLFADSLPDGWGLLLMNRHLRSAGVDPAGVSVLDRLTFLGTRTMGALTYHPPRDAEADHRPLDLDALGRNARAIYDGSAAEVLPALVRAGGSPAGARPKVLVGVRGDQVVSGEGDLPPGFEHWLVKFAAKRDARDAGPVEYAYALMAAAAGVGMPETRLFHVGRGQRYFGVKRFDRAAGNRRVHVHTLGNLVHADFRVPALDYADFLEVTSLLTRDHRDLLRAYRQMAFNVVTHNRDDHVKNFAYTMNEAGEWSLSPAYDVVYSEGPGGEHTTSVDGEGAAPARAHVLRLAGPAGITLAEATRIVDEVNDAAGKWAGFADRAGVTKAMARRIGKAIKPL